VGCWGCGGTKIRAPARGDRFYLLASPSLTGRAAPPPAARPAWRRRLNGPVEADRPAFATRAATWMHKLLILLPDYRNVYPFKATAACVLSVGLQLQAVVSGMMADTSSSQLYH
jgi:hypothetical protein